MRALRNCDFCGAEAVGTFEMVPPELEPTEAEQRRVVLCDDCETLLADLVEPLLARVGADADAATRGRDDGGSDAGGETPRRERARGRNAARSDSTRSDSTGDAAAGANGADAGENRTDASARTGIAFEREGDAGRGRETEPEPPADGEADSTADDASSASASPPNAYGKVVRLLRNREFPIHREDAAGLVESAYDLERDEVDAVIDRAVERGEFVADGNRLRRP